MEAAALVTSFLVEGVLGLTAHDRWQSLKQYDNTSVFATRWFTIAMVVILSASVLTLLVISLWQHAGELKSWWRNRSSRAEENRKQKIEDRRQKTEDRRQRTKNKQSDILTASSNESDLEELGQIAGSKVVNVARQISSLIESVGLNDEQVAYLADFLVSRYVPLGGQMSMKKEKG